MASGSTIIPGEEDELFREPILNGEDMDDDGGAGLDGREPMDDETFGHLVSAGIAAAENYVDTYLSPKRELAARYYDGEAFGNEVAGRSQVVATEVRDAILAMLPGLLRIFCGTTNPVEFEANPGTPSEQADQQTAMVSHVIFRDNPGYEIVRDAMKDALQRKTGVFTWWWEERETVTSSAFTDLPEQALMLLQLEAEDNSDADVGIEFRIDVTDQRPDETQPGGSMVPDVLAEATPEDRELAGQAPRMLTSGTLYRRVLRRRVRVAAVPPEEFIATPQATADLDRFTLVGRRMERTIGELVSLGHDEEEIREAIGGQGDGAGSALQTNPEAIQRNEGANLDKLFDAGFESADPASEYVKYCEVYVLVDYDGDGIPERRKICTVGASNHIIYNELHDDDMVPFGPICPDPEAHSPFGGSVADWTMDLQEIKSEAIRGMLDSLAESIVPSRAVDRRRVNMGDVMNTGRGAVLRVDGTPADAIYDLARPFVGQQVLPVLAYVDEMKTRRTGTNPASPSGIDMDALQSTAKEGVQAVVDSSHDRLEMIARNFAETGFTRLVKGVRNLLCRHQDHRRVLRLMGKPAVVDPRNWVADLDTTANVGIGRGNGQKRLQGLGAILAKQEMAIQTYGPNNGVIGMEEYAYTLAEFCRELGFSDPTRFVKAYTPEMQQRAEELANAAASKPTPEELLYRAQSEKSQADMQTKLAAIMERREAAIRADATKGAEINMRFAIEAAKLLGTFGSQVEQQAETLRLEGRADKQRLAQEEREDAHALADDLNAGSPEPKPAPTPAPGQQPPGGLAQGGN
jgi:hypothetical protein